MNIGKITFDRTPVCLAPMAGTSSVTYRGLWVEQGASYAPTELVSARSILYNGIGKSFRYMEIDPAAEGITCIQLFGSEEKMDIARYAARLIAPGDYVYIDAGTTTEMLVDFIKEQKATYVTNSLTNARKLVRKGLHVRLFLCHWFVNPFTTDSLYGIIYNYPSSCTVYGWTNENDGVHKWTKNG